MGVSAASRPEVPPPASSADSPETPVPEAPTLALPTGASPLRFLEPTLCDLPAAPPPPTLRDFDWCAFVKDPLEIWKDPKRRHACTRAKTPEEKAACAAPDEYLLLGVAYADVVPPVQRIANASLCDGEEALLLLRVDTPEGTRFLVQARCASSFPPDPLRAGLNGEFQLPPDAESPTWFVVGSELGAVYRRTGRVCRHHWTPDRSSVARYGGRDDETCLPQ